MHQSIIYILYIRLVRNRETLLHDNATCIYIVIKEESSNTRLCLTIDNSPIDRSCTAVLWQQGSVNIKGTKLWHCPYNLWQHPECHHYLQVCLIALKLFQEIGILHLHRLKHWQSMLYSIQLHLRRLQSVLMSAHRLIRLRNHSHHIVAALYKALEGFHSKLWGSHKYDS